MAEYNRALGLLRLLALWAIVAVLLAVGRPTVRGVSLGLLFVASGEAIRLWAAGHLTKTTALVTSVPYRYTRNPLYLGRLLIFTGLCVMVRLPDALSWLVLAAGWVVFFGYYLPRKERVEPARLLEIHGTAYADYRGAVPALFPTRRPWKDASRRRWSLRRMLGNREHWMVAGEIAIAAFLLWRAYSPAAG